MTRPAFALSWSDRRPISTYETEACALAMADRKVAVASAQWPLEPIVIHVRRGGRLIKVVARCRDHEREDRAVAMFRARRGMA